MKRILNFFKIFIINIFKQDDIEYFDMLDEYEEYVNGQDLTKRDTLVGAVRSKKQYGENYKHSFYHIPEQYVKDPDSIEYVALYRSKNTFEKDDPGILHYSKVISCERIKRGDISELSPSWSPDNYYYKFNVEKWLTLPTLVRAREVGPHVCTFTNSYLLINSHYFNELFITDNNMFKLHLALIDISRKVYDGFFVGEWKVRVKGKKIIVFNSKDKFNFRLDDYKRYPFGTLTKIYELIFDTESHSDK